MVSVELKARNRGRPRRAVTEAPAADRRAQIVDAAARVLGRQGYEATSMKEIADEAGVSSGLLHYYFGTKEDLLAAVVRSIHEELMAEWRATMAGLDDPLEKVAAGTRHCARRVAEKPGHFKAIFDLYALALRNPTIAERVKALVDEFVAEIAQVVRDVTAEMPTPSPIPADDLALALAGAVDGIALLAALRQTESGGAYRALLALELSYAGMAFLGAGKEVPLGEMLRLLKIDSQD
jgi:AcrR family transcriptional regulator